jgi:hypothetical protein
MTMERQQQPVFIVVLMIRQFKSYGLGFSWFRMKILSEYERCKFFFVRINKNHDGFEHMEVRELIVCLIIFVVVIFQPLSLRNKIPWLTHMALLSVRQN